MNPDRKTRITTRLNGVFAPSSLVVRDVSGEHFGHAGWREGGETHFEIEIAAKALTGLSRIDAHRAINEALREEFENGLHALQIKII